MTPRWHDSDFRRWALRGSDGRAIAAVAVALDRCRWIRRGSGAVPPVADKLERCLCNRLTAVAVSQPLGPRHGFHYTSGAHYGLLQPSQSADNKTSSSSSFIFVFIFPITVIRLVFIVRLVILVFFIPFLFVVFLRLLPPPRPPRPSSSSLSASSSSSSSSASSSSY